MALQKLYRCVALWGFLLTVVSFYPQPATAQGNLQERDKWVSRLKENATQALAQMDKSDPWYSDTLYEDKVRAVANVLVLTGRYDEVWPWIESHHKLTVEDYLLVAQWYSSADQVDYAVKLADQLADPDKAIALNLIVVSQAKRGDIQDALKLLPKISDAYPHAKDGAIHAICLAYAREKKYDEAEKLRLTQGQADMRETTESSIEMLRKPQTPSEPGYAKLKAKSSINSDAAIIRWVAEAEVALANGNKPLAQRHLMKASEMLRKVNSELTTHATIEIGKVADQAGMTDFATQAFRFAIETELNNKNYWQAFRNNLRRSKPEFKIFTRLISTEEIERMLQRSQNNSSKTSLTGDLIAALIEKGELEKASQFYQGQTSAENKYEICLQVLTHAFDLQLNPGLDITPEILYKPFQY